MEIAYIITPTHTHTHIHTHEEGTHSLYHTTRKNMHASNSQILKHQLVGDTRQIAKSCEPTIASAYTKGSQVLNINFGN